MKIPSTDDSLYDGSRQYHQFTDPPSSSFFQVLPSSPPQQDDVVMDVGDDGTDVDTDVDEPFQPQETFYSAQNQSTLRTQSNAAKVKALAKRSFSFKTDPATFVQQVIEDPQSVLDKKGVLTVNFEGCNLEELPSDFCDLRFVTPEPSQTMLFLAKNRISTLPTCLFNMSNITVLSLRDNDLDMLPPAIMNLCNLTELHIGGNNLRWLPFEITQLPLHTLTLTPNPLLEPSHAGCGDEYRASEKCASLLDIAMAKYLEIDALQYVPRLSKHLRAKISQEQFHKKQCTLCREVYVHEAVALMRWASIFRQSNVPLKLGFCSTGCYSQYLFPRSSKRCRRR